MFLMLEIAFISNFDIVFCKAEGCFVPSRMTYQETNASTILC